MRDLIQKTMGKDFSCSGNRVSQVWVCPARSVASLACFVFCPCNVTAAIGRVSLFIVYCARLDEWADGTIPSVRFLIMTKCLAVVTGWQWILQGKRKGQGARRLPETAWEAADRGRSARIPRLDHTGGRYRTGRRGASSRGTETWYSLCVWLFMSLSLHLFRNVSSGGLFRGSLPECLFRNDRTEQKIIHESFHKIFLVSLAACFGSSSSFHLPLIWLSCLLRVPAKNKNEDDNLDKNGEENGNLEDDAQDSWWTKKKRSWERYSYIHNILIFNLQLFRCLR